MLKDIINAVIIKGNRRKNFREVAEEWLIYKKNRVKESTYYNYAYCLEKYIYPKFAKKNIEKIRDYNGYIEELSKEVVLDGGVVMPYVKVGGITISGK